MVPWCDSELCVQTGISFPPLPLASLLFSAICKASLDNHFAFLHFFFLGAQMVKNPPAEWETWVQSLGWKDFLEKGMPTYSSILAWRIPWSV